MAKRPKLGQYLEWQGNRIRVVVDVPKALREHVGKTKLKASLGTDSPANAERLKWPVIARLKAELDGAARVAENPRIKEALEWRRSLERAQRADERAQVEDEAAEEAGTLAVLLDDRAEEIERSHGLAEALAFAGVVHGTATPLKLHLEAFLGERPFSARYKDDIRRAVGRLATWCAKERVPETLEAITRKVAGQFISRELAVVLGNRKTINKDISALSSYWRWLETRGHVTHSGGNPWERQGFEVPKRSEAWEDGDSRAFTAQEAQTLLYGPASQRLKDIMWIGALTGMRIDEVCRLQVRDCVGGWFAANARRHQTGEGKTDAARRDIPIHPQLAALVMRCSAGKQPTDLLISGLPAPDPTGKRKPSAAAGQEFTRYRRALQVDDRVEGQRRSRVVFHSWRAWFITEALRAGHQLHIVKPLVGHASGGVTVQSYFRDGPSAAQFKAVVESVQPPPPPKETPADPSQDGPRKAVGGKRRGRPPKSSAFPKEG